MMLCECNRGSSGVYKKQQPHAPGLSPEAHGPELTFNPTQVRNVPHVQHMLAQNMYVHRLGKCICAMRQGVRVVVCVCVRLCM